MHSRQVGPVRDLRPSPGVIVGGVQFYALARLTMDCRAAPLVLTGNRVCSIMLLKRRHLLSLRMLSRCATHARPRMDHTVPRAVPCHAVAVAPPVGGRIVCQFGNQSCGGTEYPWPTASALSMGLIKIRAGVATIQCRSHRSNVLPGQLPSFFRGRSTCSAAITAVTARLAQWELPSSLLRNDASSRQGVHFGAPRSCNLHACRHLA